MKNKKMKNKKIVVISSVIVAGFLALYDYKFILSVICSAVIVGLISLTVAEILHAVKELKRKNAKRG